MENYDSRVAENLLPKSIAGTVPEALQEWHFTEDTIDHGCPCETCQLCDKEDLRYHFRIMNSLTNQHLWIGSQCILRFSIAVYDDGKLLSAKESKRKLSQILEKMRLEACIRALEKLSATEKNEILENALIYYRKHKKLTPRFAFVVFWRLNQNNIDYSPSFFKITLSKRRYIDDLGEMPTDRVQMFWQALTSSQRKKAVEIGHKPPH